MERVYRTAPGGRAQGGVDPVLEEGRVEEEHGPNDVSWSRR
jgi:hypothetical protein